ncbi:hypothetical protein chiPu_0000436 [Chiloscyllium punctatum]|uniref:Uncharacterized protein n=1 Tax=Chiloscyllium punctatum TaxID=137246 RepID=A0A401RVA9_CHIPU|nr:hypothetical protein [Chiloscyllium punctatum]
MMWRCPFLLHGVSHTQPLAACVAFQQPASQERSSRAMVGFPLISLAVKKINYVIVSKIRSVITEIGDGRTTDIVLEADYLPPEILIEDPRKTLRI